MFLFRYTPLHYAALAGDISAIQTYASMNEIEVESCTYAGNTPLHFAAREGFIGKRMNIKKQLSCTTGAAITLLACKANIDSQNTKGYTPLMMAVRHERRAMVITLLERNANLNLIDYKGNTVLTMIITKGKTKLLEIMWPYVIEAKADVSKAMYLAAYYGHADMIEQLIKRHQSADSSSVDGLTPLYAAAERGLSDTVRKLVRLGANVNKKVLNGNAPLHTAAHKGHTDTVNTLLSLGAKVNITNRGGYTPLDLAIISKNISTVRALLRHQATSRKENIGTSLLTVDEALSQMDFRVNANVDLQLKTPLHRAAEMGDTAMVIKILRLNKLDVNVQMKLGIAPIECAAMGGFTETVKMLAKFGATVDTSRYRGTTPLIVAAQFGHTETVR